MDSIEKVRFTEIYLLRTTWQRNFGLLGRFQKASKPSKTLASHLQEPLAAGGILLQGKVMLPLEP